MCKIAVEVKVFVIGGMIEDRILKDLKPSSYEDSTTATNDYIKKNGLFSPKAFRAAARASNRKSSTALGSGGRSRERGAARPYKRASCRRVLGANSS